MRDFTCYSCGGERVLNSKICPHCGAENMTGPPDEYDELVRLRSEVAELKAGRLAFILDCERLATDLEQALRQWKFYAEMREEDDLDKANHCEGEAYRAGVKRAKEWRDKAAAISTTQAGASG